VKVGAVEGICKLFREWTGAPLLLARHSIVVAVHLCSRAILQEELGFSAGRHLRAMGSSVAAALALHGLGGLSASPGWFGGSHLKAQNVLLILCIAVSTKRDHACEPNECSERRTTAPRIGCASAWVRGRRSNCVAINANRLRLSVLTAAKFVGERLTQCRTRSVTRKGADVNEQLTAFARRSDEAKAAIVVPGSKSACEWH
jgi:hypothetical protein